MCSLTNAKCMQVLRRPFMLVAVCIAVGVALPVPAEESKAPGTDSSTPTVTGPSCGLYCVYVLGRLAGQEPNFVDLLCGRYLDTSKGSTLSALKRAAEDNGLHTEIIINGTTRLLQRCPYKAILHVRSGARGEASEECDHYILYLGFEQGRAWICDPPDPPRLMAFSQLAPRWAGRALLVSRQAIDMKPVMATERGRLIGLAITAIVFLGLLHLLRTLVRWPGRWHRVSARLALSGAQVTGMAILTVLVAVAYHFVRDEGFIANAPGVDSIQTAHAADFLPKIGRERTEAFLLEGDAVFVDARSSKAFVTGHIEGALSIPVDVNDAIRRHLVREVPMDAPVVVYCQSAGCRYADRVASRLRLDGFSRVSVFREGWVGWTQRRQ